MAGLGGGLLTVSYLLLQRRPSSLGMGLSPSVFGLALAGYFWLVNRDRSILKGASLTAISWATFWLAFIVAGGEMMSHLGRHTSSADAVAFFAGGVVGSLVMSTATFSLYANAQPTLWRLLVCTIGGGLLGVAGQQLGYLSEPHAGSNPTPALFIVWQTGMGFLIGHFWPTIEAREPTRLSIVDAREESANPNPL